MNFYLDPVFLSVTEDAWKNNSYSDIFSVLKDNLELFEEIEENHNKKFEIFKILFTDKLWTNCYSNNPFINTPPNINYSKLYQKYFSSHILKRMYICSDYQVCDDEALPSISIPVIKNSFVPKNMLDSWIEMLKDCGECGKNQSKFLISIRNYSSVSDSDSDSFFRVIIYKYKDIYVILEPYVFFPDNNSAYKEKQLNNAIEIYYQKMVINNIWEKCEPQKYKYTDKFWKTLKTGKIQEKSNDYKKKLIETLAAVIYNYGSHVNAHCYSGNNSECINFENRRYPKWSAYVYKMGESIGDNKCSRVFYFKKDNIIHFFEFNPDYHAGE